MRLVERVDRKGKKISLMTIYSFITGRDFLPRIPTLETITYSFDKTTSGTRRPVASTCGLTIKMPLTLEKEQMEAVWLSALLERETFLSNPIVYYRHLMQPRWDLLAANLLRVGQSTETRRR